MSRPALEARGSLLPRALFPSPVLDPVEIKAENLESPPRDETPTTFAESRKRAAENGLNSDDEDEEEDAEERLGAPRRKQPKTEEVCCTQRPVWPLLFQHQK